MQTNRGEVYSPAQWFLIACGGDLVLKLAHDLNIGEDPTGELVLNPPDDDSLIRVSRENDHLALRVTTLNMTLSVGDQRSVQYLSIDDDRTVQIHLPHNTVVLTTNFMGGGRDPDALDVAMRQATVPSITTERMVLTGEHPAIPDVGDELDAMIGPLIEVDVIPDEDHEPRDEPALGTPPPGPDQEIQVFEPEPPLEEAAPPRAKTGGRGRIIKRVVMVLLGLAAALIALPLAD